MKLAFWAEAQQLGALLTAFLGVSGSILFACLVGWGISEPLGQLTLLGVVALAAVAVYSLWSCRRVYRQMDRFKRDLRSACVKEAEGSVVWNGWRYEARLAGGERLQFEAALHPGPYRFYFVPSSRVMLSSEPLGSHLEAREALLRAMMHARHFDDAALAANRQGRMSEGQKRDVEWQLWSATALKFAALLLFGAAFVAALVNLQIGQGADYRWTALLAAAPFVILMAALIHDAFIARAEIKLGRVQYVQGQGTCEENAPIWSINETRFKVSRRSAAALVCGVRYRAFYLSSSKQLLSLEPLA